MSGASTRDSMTRKSDQQDARDGEQPSVRAVAQPTSFPLTIA